jgi:serine protease Do
VTRRFACLVLAALLGAWQAIAAPPPDPVAVVVARVKPEVVRIITVRAPKPGTEDAADRSNTAVGSGFVIDPAGFIATNKHVVDGAVSVFVATNDGVRYKARIVGMTYGADIALLKIEAGRKLPAVSFANSDSVRVGDAVIAIGSPFGFDGSVTAGIVSAVNRDIMESPFDDYIQTDAPINHGNSGGPLFNTAGEVIGMNSVLFAPGTVSGSIGLGFAIPSNDLQFVLGRLKEFGIVKAGMLPVRTQQVTWMIAQALGVPSLAGALVAGLDDAGDKMMDGQIKPGDVILTFNGETVLDPRDLARQAGVTPIGQMAELGLLRGGERLTVKVAVQGWPEVDTSGLKDKSPPHLGLQLASLASDRGPSGVTVEDVDPDGTAADSGLRKGDVILQVQQTPVTDPGQALRILRLQSSLNRQFAVILVERDGKRTWIPVAVPD